MNKVLKKGISFLLGIVLALTSIEGLGTLTLHAAGETQWAYTYTGSVQTFTAPYTGRYYVEMYGASGGGASKSYGGQGGKTTGYIDLRAGETINIVVGGQGSRYNGGYNGGGSSTASYGGGGCTFVAKSGISGTITSYAGHTDLIYLAAGGGGGCGSRINTSDIVIGKGGGLEKGNHNVYAHTNTMDPATTSYNVFGQGGQGINGGGGGGGGIAGGPGFNGNYPGDGGTIGGGWGGSGYIGANARDAISLTSNHLGDGSVKIKYNGKVQTTVIIDLGDGATSNGSSRITLTGYAGETANFSFAVKSGYTFAEFNRKYGDATISGRTVTFGMNNTTFDAIYVGNLTLKTHINGNLMDFEFIENDSYTKFYRLYESLNAQTWDYVNAGSENQNDRNESKTYTYTGDVVSLPIVVSAKYTMKLWGACGGGSTAQGQSKPANGYGGYTSGYKWITAGTTLYIAVGGQGQHGSSGRNSRGGWNGGGSGSKDGEDDEGAGGGGGATHVAIGTNRGVLANYASYRNEIIAVAGGGGGREYDYASGYGGGEQGGEDSRGNIATQTSGYAFGKGGNGSGSGDDSDGVAGGGGGWYGGYANSHHGRGGGGGSGYKGGLDEGNTIAGQNTSGNGKVIISWLDRRITKASVEGVLVTDKAAPNKPSDATLNGFSADVIINWKDNGDNGTTYYHRVESYNADNGELLCKSNVTADEIISGVDGFYYKYDNSSAYTVTKSDTFTHNNFAPYDVNTRYRYLHIATVDKAGNLSGTYTYRLPIGVVINFDGNDIIYNRNGDRCTSITMGDTASQVVPFNSSAHLNKNGYTKRGYKFVNWNTEEGGSGSTFTDEQLVNYEYLVDEFGYVITLYAQWIPIEYDIYYDKGLTTDTTITEVSGATRNTNLQATGTNRPYRHVIYDSNVTFATANNVKGRHYKLSYDPNIPELDDTTYKNKQGGNATDAIRASYNLTINGVSDLQTIHNVKKNDENKIATVEGTLANLKKWGISEADSDTKGPKTVDFGATITQPNYRSTDRTYCVATIQYETLNLKNWAYAEPSLDGYVFLGWYDKPEYEIVPDGKGGFTHDTKGSRLVTNLADYTSIQPSKDDWNKTVYAHWMPVMAYLNYSADDTTKGREYYLERKEGHLVNDLKDGYLTKDVHVGTEYWEYAGRPEASSFFMPEKDLKNYVPYASIPNPALYFDVYLYPRTLVNTKTSVETTVTDGDNFQVMLPNKFLTTVFDFKQASGGIGTRDTLLNANLAANTWTQEQGVGVNYGGTLSDQAEGTKYKYKIYDVWTLEGWYLSNKNENRTLDTKITADTRINNADKSDKWSFDLVAVWTKRPTDMKMPLPKRLLVFNMKPEGGVFKYEDNESVKDKVLANIDSADSPQINLRKLAQGEEITYADSNDTIANIYKGKQILADTSNSLVYDFKFEAWENTEGTDTVVANDQAGKDGKIDKHSNYYAKWNLDNDLVLPQLEKEGYVFLGWYTVPQGIVPPANKNTHTTTEIGSVDKEYWVGAGYDFVDGNLVSKDCHLQKDCRTIDWNVSTNQQTLYAWFNREPVFVDMYEGLFFEGQDVSLSDLKKLVGVFDFEDDYNAIILEYIESLPEVDKDALYLPVIVDKEWNFEVDKDYSEAEIAQTIQTEDYYFDDSRWEPYSSVYWQKAIENGEWEKLPEEGEGDYDELPTGEEGESGDIQSTNKPIYITDGKLYTPRRSDGVDGVYKSKETGEIYYTAEAKEELVYYVQNNEDGSKRNTQLNVRVKSITYKVNNKSATEDECVISGIPGVDERDTDKYDVAINHKTTTTERSRYTNNDFINRKGKTETRSISDWRVDTSTGRIIMKTDENGKTLAEGEGFFDVTYEITDNGIMFNGAILSNTPITLTYTRECKIQYNKLPQIYISNIMDFTNTNYGGNTDEGYKAFVDSILDAQTVVDGEDNVTNLPWWTYKKTTPKLVRSIEIVKVNHISFDLALLDKYGLVDQDGNKDSRVTELEGKTYETLETLYRDYKCATPGSIEWKLWQCISNFNVVVDAHDQWGKYASGKVVPNWKKKSQGGDGKPKVGDDGEGVWIEEINDDDPRPKQTEDYRTITVILINDEDDLSMNAANIMQTVRFVGSGYLSGIFDSLGGTYWGTTGKNELLEILNRHENGGNSNDYDTSFHNDLGTTVDIHVEDYTTD